MKIKLVAALFILLAASFGSLCLMRETGGLLANVPWGSVVTDQSGTMLRIGLSRDDKYRLPVKLEDISPAAIDAALEYEDKYFFSHPGVNPAALFRGAFSLLGHRRLGGSTITMQVARLRYGLRTTSISGKLEQIWRALRLELAYSKQEILEAYLNLAPYGANIEGIEAASRIYFHKPASKLTKMEGVALALIPQNPNARAPIGGKALDSARKRFLEANGEKGAAAPPLHFYSLNGIPFRAPHLSSELLGVGGQAYIRSTIELDLQNMLERSVGNFIGRGKMAGINNAAAAIVNTRDMSVCALVGSADWRNAFIGGQIDGTKTRRSPGSTLKPFIYALALDEGLIHPQTILADSPKSFGGYDPENFDRGFKGPVAAHEALKASRNVPAIALAEKLREEGLYGFLRKAGVRLERDADYYGLALVLGGAEVTLRELLGLYGILANGGNWRPLKYHAAEENGACARLLSPEAAWLAMDMLKRPEANLLSFGKTVPLIYKTGTSNGFRDAWTVGLAGEYAIAVWIGNFDNSANPYFVGSWTALPLFEEIARNLGQLRKLRPLAKEPEGLNLSREKICVSTGDIYRGQCRETVDAWIMPGVSPVRDTGIFRKVRIDRATGLRACDPDPQRTEERWMEFWPSDLAKIFKSAGAYVPDPPNWLPECQNRLKQLPGMAPRIILPKKNVVYQRKLSQPDFRLPLMAALDAEAAIVHWYGDGKFLGSAKAGEAIFWSPEPGVRRLLAIDSNGRESGITCKIDAIP